MFAFRSHDDGYLSKVVVTVRDTGRGASWVLVTFCVLIWVQVTWVCPLQEHP